MDCLETPELQEERRCPLLDFDPYPEEGDDFVTYLEKKEIGSGETRAWIDTTPCFQCPEGCAIQVSKLSDELQRRKDFPDSYPKIEIWNMREWRAYAVLRKSEWVK